MDPALANILKKRIFHPGIKRKSSGRHPEYLQEICGIVQKLSSYPQPDLTLKPIKSLTPMAACGTILSVSGFCTTLQLMEKAQSIDGNTKYIGKYCPP